MVSEALEAGLVHAAGTLRLVLEGLSLATVLIGLLASLRLIRPRRRGDDAASSPLQAVRLRFGTWLALALEFQLGADIVATTTSPSRDTLIQLAVVAVIRTFLNVFLARELEAERRLAMGEETLSHQP